MKKSLLVLFILLFILLSLESCSHLRSNGNKHIAKSMENVQDNPNDANLASENIAMNASSEENPTIDLESLNGLLSESPATNLDNIIVPGKRVGFIEIGKPLPKDLIKVIGVPDTYCPPTDSKDSGSLSYRSRYLIKLNDGVSKQNVYTIYISPEAQDLKTLGGLHIGSSLTELKEKYPKLKSLGYGEGPGEYWKSKDGLLFQVLGDKIIEIDVTKPE